MNSTMLQYIPYLVLADEKAASITALIRNLLYRTFNREVFMLTQKELKEALHYNPETGLFIWRQNRCNTMRRGCIAGKTTARGYRNITYKRKEYPAHRLAWLYMYGEFPLKNIDHINGDRSDNRIENLRDVCQSHNGKNIGIMSNNKTGIMGVYWHKTNARWSASITSKSKHIYIGSFIDFFDACCARKSAELEYGFHPNHGKRASY